MASTVYHFSGSAPLSGRSGNYGLGTFTVTANFGEIINSSGVTIYNEDGGPYPFGGIVSDGLGPGAPTTFPGTSPPATVNLVMILAPATFSPLLPAGTYTAKVVAIYTNGLTGSAYGQNVFSITFAFTVVYGCTDSTATNFDSGATVDDGSCTYGGGPGGGVTLLPAMGMHEDGHRRTVVVTVGGALSFQTTKDGGHTFDPYGAGGTSPQNASVWVDPRTNRPRILWDDGSGGGITLTDAGKDGEQSDWT